MAPPPVSVERRPVAFTYQGQNKICAGPSSLREAINTASSTAFFNLDPATVELQFEHFGICLVELSSGTALSYLFWEAHSTGDLTPTSIATEKATKLTQPFNPNLASLTPTNSLALPFADLLPYLDATLKSLTLHTSARNDFSTYWLPSFARIHNRGQRIALRFVEQAAYQQAAKLEVEPEPDVVTRVFMLFKGVQQGEVRGEESFDWSKIVGVEDGADDATKFRVLEWGGMEVLS